MNSIKLYLKNLYLRKKSIKTIQAVFYKNNLLRLYFKEANIKNFSIEKSEMADFYSKKSLLKHIFIKNSSIILNSYVEDTTLENTVIKNSFFERFTFECVCIDKLQFISSNLSVSNLTSIVIIQSLFSDSCFENNTINITEFINCKIQNCCFKRKLENNIVYIDSNPDEEKFKTHFDVKDSLIERTIFDGLILDFSKFGQSLILDSRFEDCSAFRCDVCEVVFNNVTFINVNFIHNRFRVVEFQNCIFENCKFNESNLLDVDFTSSLLKNCSFDAAILRNTMIYRNNAESLGCSFKNAVFTNK